MTSLSHPAPLIATFCTRYDPPLGTEGTSVELQALTSAKSPQWSRSTAYRCASAVRTEETKEGVGESFLPLPSSLYMGRQIWIREESPQLIHGKFHAKDQSIQARRNSSEGMTLHWRGMRFRGSRTGSPSGEGWSSAPGGGHPQRMPSCPKTLCDCFVFCSVHVRTF